MNTNLELEQQLLGTIIRYPDAMRQTTGLSVESFSDDYHKAVFAEMLRVTGDSERISIASIALKTGNPQYLAKLAASDSVHDVRESVSVLVELASRRMVESVARLAIQTVERGGMAAEAIDMLSSLNSADIQTRTMHDSAVVTESILKDLDNDVRPFSTGLSHLDEAMGGGVYPGKAYGFAARKKVGKTILLGTISHNLNMNGVKHLFICGEMGEKEIQQRVLCRALDMYPSAFRSGYAKQPEVMRKITEYIQTAPRNVIYLDSPGITFDRLKQAVVSAHLKYGIKGFILDYWQLVGGKNGKDSESFHLGEVAQWIAEIGRKLGIFSLTAAQINQEGNTRGGEGMRLAFDQVYHLQPIGSDGGDVTMPGRWLEMMDTRYTPWMNIGEEGYAGLMLNEKGLFFEEC